MNKQKAREFHQRLQPYVLTAAQLRANGFPAFVPGTREVTMKTYALGTENTSSADSSDRVCTRCKTRFALVDNGKSECCFHWGKTFTWRGVAKPYTCCGKRPGKSKGCERAKFHVYRDNKYTDVSGYVSAPSADALGDGNPGVYALDCEMVFTTAGSELAKVTVLDHNLDVVLEEVVKPSTPVIDCHTRFSGLTKEDMKDVTTSLKDIHEILLRMFTEKTILVGHSLEHDLIALKLVHATVVDTSVAFPHSKGPPYKRGLKKLALDVLGKHIQVDDVKGHDSGEDASACMELMLRKIRLCTSEEFRI